MNEWIDEWIDGWINEWMNEYLIKKGSSIGFLVKRGVVWDFWLKRE